MSPDSDVPSLPRPRPRVNKFWGMCALSTWRDRANVPSIVGRDLVAPTSGTFHSLYRVALRFSTRMEKIFPGKDFRVTARPRRRGRERERERRRKRKESALLKGTRFWIPRPVTLDRTFYTPPFSVPSCECALTDASYATECRRVQTERTGGPPNVRDVGGVSRESASSLASPERSRHRWRPECPLRDLVFLSLSYARVRALFSFASPTLVVARYPSSSRWKV